MRFLERTDVRFLMAGIVFALSSVAARWWVSSRPAYDGVLLTFSDFAIPGLFTASLFGMTGFLPIMIVSTIVNVLLWGAVFCGIGLLVRRSRRHGSDERHLP